MHVLHRRFGASVASVHVLHLSVVTAACKSSETHHKCCGVAAGSCEREERPSAFCQELYQVETAGKFRERFGGDPLV